jgi:hypothetical protein
MLGHSWSTTTTNLLSAALLWSMGVLVLWVGWAGETSYSPDAQKGIYSWLRDALAAFTNWLGVLSPLVVVAAVALIIVLIRGTRNARIGTSET